MKQTFKSKERILYRFTQEDEAAMAHDLAEKLGVLNANKDAAKDTARDFRGIIKDNESDCNEIKRKITDGEEYRDVPVEITFNHPKNGWKSCKNTNTGEQLWEREMTTGELQSTIPFPSDTDLTIISGEGTEDDPYIFKPTDEVTKEDVPGFGEDDGFGFGKED